MPLIDPVEWTAFKVLRRRLGLWRAIGVGLAVQKAARRGAPFESFGPPVDAKDRGSRAQLGPAVVLYRELKRRGREDARDVVAQVIHDSALTFLGRTIGPIKQEKLAALSAEERRAWLEEVGGRFPNSDMVWDTLEPNQVAFRVTNCRFVAMCRDLGEADLAPLFCAGDATFFGTVEPNVRLERPHTLANGGADCPFTLTWIDEPKVG